MQLHQLTLWMLLLLSSSFLAAQKTLNIKSKTAFTIGETLEVESAILGENRVLNIYLPNGYSKESSKTYPVIYLLDGSIDEDFIHIAGLVQFGSFSWINLLPETIVVGIGNVDRKRDFTYPTNNEKDKKDFPTTGGSEKFIRFIAKELQPFIAKEYAINDTKTLIGQSLGGLLATEILFKQPNLFDNYIIVSPSLWWDDQSLLSWNLPTYTTSKSIYIAVGKEGKVMEGTAKELYKKVSVLDKKNTKTFFEFLEAQDHGDALHLAVYKAFESIFEKVKEKE
ncbi:alpha/beta hydrolase-fold protein [Aureispira sp. CCB-E]|uniref:alpha/beta hydrolase n=1 Tax=Aureispira sp. CCB-E TaxID=3051121 RepID=UPI002868B283|nr:alpha/beta hydrolase-fold protein [Aureispira sp. CCB-E]WMX12851.1 alpha/beta hydrolase-fold protein [Aureispira sp. CCB-E]